MEEFEVAIGERIEHYLAARSDPSLYQSVRNMSQFVSDDYGNRFLIELIQNAHDAHDPARTDGEIAIAFDADEGEHGCLYVANRGAGFTWDNLKAITSIALSSKPVNAGIGNKGLGFRSVLQICAWPEIYSVDGVAAQSHFDGYCFRFARTQAEREEQKRRKTEITFAGQTYSGLEAGYVDLAAAVHAGLKHAARFLDLKASHKTLQTLEDPTPSSSPGRGRGHGTGTPKIPEASMSDTQKKAIGIVGEVCARKWIALTHSIDVDESVWVSRYRDAVLITGGGSDLLGYDFVVATKSRTYYYLISDIPQPLPRWLTW